MAQPPPLPAGQPGSGPESGDAGADPSMEDILASIRRILSEEEQAGEAAPADDTPHQGAIQGAIQDAPHDVLLLNEDMMVPEPTHDQMNPGAAEVAPVQPAAPVAVPFQPAPVLVAPEAAQAAASSLGALRRTIAQERGTVVRNGGPTIEDLVREEMRPVLKAWLDAHLPALVERLVQAEIARVVGQANS